MASKTITPGKTPIVVFGNGKGGVGKSTDAILCSLAFAHAGFRVGIRDTDSQASLTNCLSLAVFQDLPIVAAPRGAESAHDIIIADGPPSVDEPGFLADFDRCGLMCLVTRTGTLDLQTTGRSYAYLAARRPTAQIVVLVNAYDDRLRLDRDLDGNLTAAGLEGVPRFKTLIHDREIFRHVVYAGWAGAAALYKERNSYRAEAFNAAQAETAALAQEIRELTRG